MAEIHPNDYETPKAKMYAQLLMEDSVLSQCGKLVIKLAQLPQANEDNEDENPNEIELKKLIVKARSVCEDMKRKGMLKPKSKTQK